MKLKKVLFKPNVWVHFFWIRFARVKFAWVKFARVKFARVKFAWVKFARVKFARVKFVRWLPLAFLAGIFCWLLWVRAEVDLRLVALGGLSLGVGLWASGFGRQGLCASILVLPLIWQLWWWHSGAETLIRQAAGGKDWLWISGVVRGIDKEQVKKRVKKRAAGSSLAIREEQHAWLLLGKVRLSDVSGFEGRAVELRVRLPVDVREQWRVRKGLPLLLGVRGLDIFSEWGRLVIVARESVWRPLPEEVGWGGSLQRRLSLRAGYYLDAGAHAVYRPVLLGLRGVETPEGRAVVRGFRDAGVAHLLAISGLHVGLFFGVFWFVLVGVRFCIRAWSLAESGKKWQRWLAMGLVWAQIAMIGWPSPAVRAGVMGSMLLGSGLAGLRIAKLHLLGIAALLLLCWDASVVYEISFQLSFLAYFFLALGLGCFPRRRGERTLKRWWLKLLNICGRFVGMNLWVSAFIILGLWPLTSYVFGRISLLSFAGNLLIAPLLGLIVLPVGLAAMVLSLGLMFFQISVGGWLEWMLFMSLQFVLDAWLVMVEFMRESGAMFVFEHHLGWSLGGLLWFYLGFLLLVVGWFKWQQEVMKLRSTSLGRRSK